jgi:hypothetical protein
MRIHPMRAAIILSLLGFSLCVAVSADEAADKDCINAGERRAQAVPGAVIKASRVRKTPPGIGPRNVPSLTLEVEITSSSINATYVYICKPNPGVNQHPVGLGTNREVAMTSRVPETNSSTAAVATGATFAPAGANAAASPPAELGLKAKGK